jgi:hypothetical protein
MYNPLMAELPVCNLVSLVLLLSCQDHTSKRLATRPGHLCVVHASLRGGVECPVQRRRPEGLVVGICGSICPALDAT